MASIISTPQVVVNNNPVAIKPNSFKFTEGRGETDVMTESAGGESIQTVFSEDATNRIAVFSFEVYSTVDALELVSNWKLNRNQNRVVVGGTDSTTGATFNRSFAQAAVTNDPEYVLSSDGTTTVEWKSAPAV